jgi:hypothetical protein
VLQEREEKIDAAVQKRVAAEAANIEKEAQEKARGSLSVEIQDLKNQLAETALQRDAAQKAELEVRTRARELDERARTLDLEAARKIDAERQKIQEAAAKRADEQYQLKLAEKEKQIQDAKKANEELKRKLEQGSQQLQGEVLELQLEEMLRSAFPTDQIEAVPKGVNGADLIHRVLSRSGRVCGMIVWESKCTKAWSEGWVPKLKDDQRKLAAEIAVLVSEVFAEGLQHLHSPERHLGHKFAVRDQFGSGASNAIDADRERPSRCRGRETKIRNLVRVCCGEHRIAAPS